MSKRRQSFWHYIPPSLPLMATAIPLLVLIGWQTDNTFLKTVIPGGIAMNPVTALSFLILASAIICVRIRKHKLAAVLAAIVATVGIVKLFSIISNIPVPFDQLIFSSKLAFQTQPNRIAPNTALNFFLLGTSILLLLPPKLRKMNFVSNGMALFSVFLALVAINGYFYGLRSLYGIGSFIPMAFPTAVCFLLLSSAILLLRPHSFLKFDVQKNLFDAHYLKPRFIATFLIIPVIFLGVNAVSFRNTRAFVSSRTNVENSYSTIVLLDTTFQALLDAETGQRGYLLTGEEHYLDSYNSAIKTIPALMQQLRSTNVINQGQLNLLSDLSWVKLGVLKQTIELKKQGKAQEALTIVLTDKGKNAMDSIRVLVAEQKKQQYEALDTNKNIERSSSTLTVTSIVAGTVLNLLLLIGLYILTIKQLSTQLAEKDRIEKLVHKRTNELQAEHARLQSSVDSLAIGLIITDLGNNLVLINQAAQRITNISSKANVSNLQDSLKDSLDIQQTLSECMEHKKVIELPELTYGDKILRLITTPVLEHDTAIGAVVTILDISDQKALERSRDEFFSIASHELRTPLTVLRGNTRLILDMYKDTITDKDVTSMLNDMYSASSRLIETVNTFMDMTSLEQNKMIFKKDVVSLGSLFTELLGTFESRVNKGVHLVVNATNLEVLADEMRTKQVLDILLGNACQFTEKGMIVVSAQKKDKQIVISIRDTGKGIDKEHQYLLFRKFQQASENILTRDATHSTGLGLYLAKLFAEGMKGKLWLETSKPSEGSVFCLSLPTAKSIPLPNKITIK